MTKGVGFAQTTRQTSTKKESKWQLQAKRYEEMKRQGFPEFNIYVRLPNKEWLPAGSMTVERSSHVARAIFQQEAELRKAIFRKLPRLQKYQDQLEYGYRLKEFPDEPIVKVERPPASSPSLWHRLSQMAQKLWSRK